MVPLNSQGEIRTTALSTRLMKSNKPVLCVYDADLPPGHLLDVHELITSFTEHYRFVELKELQEDSFKEHWHSHGYKTSLMHIDELNEHGNVRIISLTPKVKHLLTGYYIQRHSSDSAIINRLHKLNSYFPVEEKDHRILSLFHTKDLSAHSTTPDTVPFSEITSDPLDEEPLSIKKQEPLSTNKAKYEPEPVIDDITDDEITTDTDDTPHRDHQETEKSPDGIPFYSSLKFKLVGIISLLIITSLSAMIFLASWFFRQDNEVRIQENNHRLSEIIAGRVDAEIDNYRIRSLMQLSGLEAASFIRDREIFFTGIIDHGNKTFNRAFINEELIAASGYTSEQIEESHNLITDTLTRTGTDTAQNLSLIYSTPVIAFSWILQSDGTPSYLVSYVKLDSLLKTFTSRSDATISFMVGPEGIVMAHPDREIVLSATSLADLKIVKKMQTSPVDNGLSNYSENDSSRWIGSFKKIDYAGLGIISTVPEEKAFEAVYNIQRRNLYIMGIVLSIAIMIVYFFSQSLTNPVTDLVAATRKIMEGIYRIGIKPRHKDEIGQLTRSFQSMAQGLEEREKMKDAFGRFVNPEIAEQAMKGTIKLGGERKMAAVFFSDIRSFTAISEKLEPEEVVGFLNEYMTRMVRCINDTRGVVDKYIGDAIMAVWGAPVSHGNDTANAINAALQMRSELLDFNRTRGDEKHPVIKIGCSINTGPVLAGQIGSDERMEYTVIGDTVNLSSRVEALNKPFGTDILITQDSLNMVPEMFDVVPMQKIKVKGKSEPQQIYAVLGRLDNPHRPATIDELRVLLGIDMTGLPSGDQTAPEEEQKYEILDQ